MSDEPVRVRAPVVRIVDHGASTTVIGREVARRFEGDSAALLRAVLEIHARPVSRAALLAELAARAGTTPAELPVQPIDELIALLVGDGVLVPEQPVAPAIPAHRLRRVVLGISGAIAAVDAPELVRGLQRAGCDVRLALTRNAARLVSRAALEALTHHQVWTSLWQRARRAPVPHVELAEWAELVMVCPASATTLSRIATGDCSELVAAIVAATRAPVAIVPSMNDAMYGSPAVQANLATLRAHGRHLVHPAHGLEVADQPHARRAVLGSAPPVAAVLDVVRHLLRGLPARPRLPVGAQEWEQLWATTPPAQLAWHADAVEPALAAALEAHSDRLPRVGAAGDAPVGDPRGAIARVEAKRAADRRGVDGCAGDSGRDAGAAAAKRLLDLGTGDGLVAVAAARCGFEVTAIDVAATALGRARDRAGAAGARSIMFMLDDATASSLADRGAAFDVAVDRGLLHCLPLEQRAGYAAAVSALVAIGGTLLIVAHTGADAGTRPAGADELRALLPAFQLVRETPMTLAGSPARLFKLTRRA